MAKRVLRLRIPYKQITKSLTFKSPTPSLRGDGVGPHYMPERLRTLLIIAIATVAAVVYAAIPQVVSNGHFSLKKISLKCIESKTERTGNATATADSARRDSLQKAEATKNMPNFVNGVDTTHHTVLFFGDSMTNGLSLRLDDYCHANGDNLYCVTWNSSTTKKYAESNILDTYLELYNPTYIIICLGSNELFAHDVPDREQYVRRIMEKLGDRPFVWISPPNWKKDTGMNDLIRNCVGANRFFDSSHLDLQRGDDHIHPTAKGAEKWMDLIAAWLRNPQQTAHPIRMDVPKKPFYSPYYDIYGPDFESFANGDSPEHHRHYNR